MKEKFIPASQEDIPEAEKIKEGEFSPVTAEEMKAAVEALEDHEDKEDVQERIAEIKEKLRADSGNDTRGTMEAAEETPSDGGEKRPFYFYTTTYDRMHGSEKEIFRKAFGDSIWKFLINMWKPSAWKKYRKMMKEYEDDNLAKKTHTKELGGYYTPNVREGVEK